ncbi:hypothetical protein NDU88_013012 [Pleurodeles waltl]|uniref:Uncharacterized protein n=1 Tax=Pleurodeles waltl TaxID=8319 RepID=A0AAV7R4E6_PLEWA|nr:hypothetical protein NDU88_013012 [Pleurodeles waltl]
MLLQIHMFGTVRCLVLGSEYYKLFFFKEVFLVTGPKDSSLLGSIAHGRRLYLRLFFSAVGFGRIPFRSVFRFGKLVRISEESVGIVPFGIGIVRYIDTDHRKTLG